MLCERPRDGLGRERFGPARGARREHTQDRKRAPCVRRELRRQRQEQRGLFAERRRDRGATNATARRSRSPPERRGQRAEAAPEPRELRARRARVLFERRALDTHRQRGAALRERPLGERPRHRAREVAALHGPGILAREPRAQRRFGLAREPGGPEAQGSAVAGAGRRALAEAVDDPSERFALHRRRVRDERALAQELRREPREVERIALGESADEGALARGDEQAAPRRWRAPPGGAGAGCEGGLRGRLHRRRCEARAAAPLAQPGFPRSTSGERPRSAVENSVRPRSAHPPRWRPARRPKRHTGADSRARAHYPLCPARRALSLPTALL